MDFKPYRRLQPLRLNYEIQPVILATFNVLVSGTVAGISASDLGLEYRTNRVYSRGGTIESGSDMSEALRIDNTYSDYLSALLAFGPVRIRSMVARLTAGTMTLSNWDGSTPGASVPMQVQLANVQLDYVFRSERTPLVEFVGARYWYTKYPRILYEFETSMAQGDSATITRYTEPRQVSLTAYMAGGGIGIKHYDTDSWIDGDAFAAAYLGAGPMEADAVGNEWAYLNIPTSQHFLANGAAFSCTNLSLRGELSGVLRLRPSDGFGLQLRVYAFTGISGNCAQIEEYQATKSPFYDTRKAASDLAQNGSDDNDKASRHVTAAVGEFLYYGDLQGFVEF